MTQQPQALPDLNGKFNRLLLSPEAEQLALQVSPLFLAYLKNKIAVYAESLVDTPLTYDPDPSRQVAAILAHERLRNFCQAYEELLAELIHATNLPTSTE